MMPALRRNNNGQYTTIYSKTIITKLHPISNEVAAQFLDGQQRNKHYQFMWK